MLRLSSLVVSWWLVGASFAQEPAVAPAAEPKLVHLRVIGASVSGGFKDGPLTGATEPGDTVSMHHLLKAWCGDQAKASGLYKQIIAEFEHSKRGVYAGAVGYFGFDGNSDSCIALRTVVLKDGKACVQAGAGVVADSTPEGEYTETVNKAMGMMAAIARAQGI